ncbi:MAG: hypothetical protein HC898_00895 [Phycisphaerales bacterium]|nr:hypothetical protein [Phycisphaerales bacterium]
MQIKSHWQAGLLIAGATLSYSGSLAEAQSTATTDDVYLRGYVQALSGSRSPHRATVKIQAEQGVLIIDGTGLSGEELTRLMQTLANVRGVKSVKMATEPWSEAVPATSAGKPSTDTTSSMNSALSSSATTHSTPPATSADTTLNNPSDFGELPTQSACKSSPKIGCLSL